MKSSPSTALLHRKRSFARKFIAVACLSLSAAAFSAEKQTPSTVEPWYRAHRATTPRPLRPDAVVVIEELSVPDLWSALGVQIFNVHENVRLQLIQENPFLWRDGKIYPFVNSFGGFGLTSGVVVGDAFYYSYSWGSGRHLSLVGRLTIHDGQPVRHESEPFIGGYLAETRFTSSLSIGEPRQVEGDFFVEKTSDGRIRVVIARWSGFNRWENPVPFGWIALDEPSRLKIVGDYGGEVQFPTSRIEDFDREKLDVRRALKLPANIPPSPSPKSLP